MLGMGALITATASACTSGAPSPAASPSPDATFSISVPDAAADLVPADRITVSSDGALGEVRLVSADGKHVVPGRVDSKGVWTSEEPLQLDQSYSLSATATNAEGKQVSEERTFSTVKPAVDATYWVTPDDVTVGAGMPAMITFDSAVETPEQRAAIEKRVKITTTPAQEGSWGWVDNRRLMWRPKVYWKAKTSIKVEAPLTGLQTGSGKWIREDKGATFTIAKRARVIRVDLDDHFMRVVDNGKITATYPISAGQAKGTWETRSGTKVITEMAESYTMDAGTLGVPEDHPDYYKTEVKYAVRVTDTGEFFHAAPWSVGSQGRRNVSHGCVNMSPSAAREFYRGTIIGDVAEFVDSGRPMKPADGLPVWLYSYPEWKSLSALHAQKPAQKPATEKATPKPTA